MTERIASVSVDETLLRELWPAMGYGEALPDPSIQETAVRIAELLVPKARLRYMYDFVPAEKVSPVKVVLGGKEFIPGGIIGSYLKGMTDACVFVATAGAEFDAAVRELKEEGDILADFIADAIGSVLAERAVAILEEELIADQHGVSMPYSPGYCGWNICEQHVFFSLFPPKPCGISLSESSLMSPEKSISGFFALGEELVRQPYHCDICRNKSCFKRKKH